MSDVRIFASFDVDHDGDLYSRILEQSLKKNSGFAIPSRSKPKVLESDWEERVRREMSAVDEVIVICGEHTEDSPRVCSELRIAQETQKPYFFLWGRRELMCTRPGGAKTSDSMYSWTREILLEQINYTLRKAQPREIPENCKKQSGVPRTV